MGFLNWLRGRPPADRSPSVAGGRAAYPGEVVLGGHDTLEVVGESYRQDHLWRLAGARRGERVRTDIKAMLVPEPTNPEDENAISVVIAGGLVGYLSREDALLYGPGVRRIAELHDAEVVLEGQIVGGGIRGDGPGMLGVFLHHDPADFGVRAHHAAHIGELRTGRSEAIETDLDDDSYDLSWLDQLSGSRTPADIVVLRKLLRDEADPIDRHYMFQELEASLYKCRDAFGSALEEFDVACEQHDAEMQVIRAALRAKFGCVPVIEMYRQAAIRCQKAKEWAKVRSWADRGLAVYADEAARPEAVADLEKRRAYAEDKLTAALQPKRSRPVRDAQRAASAGAVEAFTCSECGARFERAPSRGRKPHRCPACRGVAEAPVAT